MLRIVAPILRAAGTAHAVATSAKNLNLTKLSSFANFGATQSRCFSVLAPYIHTRNNTISSVQSTLLSEPFTKRILPAALQPLQTPVRTVTKFSLKKGKRKTVKAVVERFFRLHWGGWIRVRAGRHKRLWKKSPALRRRLRQHVFVNATQATLLDKMVTQFWRREKHYIDDPYAPYHTREEFVFTRKKPALE